MRSQSRGKLLTRNFPQPFSRSNEPRRVGKIDKLFHFLVQPINFQPNMKFSIKVMLKAPKVNDIKLEKYGEV